MDETTCRICCSNGSSSFRGGGVVPIFGGEGRSAELQFKIRKYLYLTISADDRLPQVMCFDCCKKLDAIDRFATMAFKIQSRFKELLDPNEKRTADNPGKRTGLLHSYLMKDRVQRGESAESTDVTEMEVRVDPTLFLQCLVDEEEEGDECDSTEEDSRSSSPQPTTFSKTEQRLIDLVATSTGRHPTIPSDTEITLSDPIRRRRPIPDVVATSGRRICRSPRESHRLAPFERPTFEGGDIPSRPVRSSNDDDDDDGCRSPPLHDWRPKDGRSYEYACPVCGKKISTKGNLKVHLETHRPKGKYECGICTRIFKTESNLRKHSEYHGGVRFPCGVCGRVYPTNSTLRAHSITHSDLRPHKCSLCDKTFKRNQDLKFHVNQHTGARPYRCSYCPKAFASSGNCFSHRKRMHPREVERDRDRATDVV